MVFFVALLLCTETLPVFSGVRVAQSLVFSVLLCKSMFCDFSFDQCIICPSSVYGFTDYPFGIFTYSMCFALRITPLASLLMLCVLLYGLPIWYLYLCYVFCFTDYPFGIFTYAMCFALPITPLASLLMLCVFARMHQSTFVNGDLLLRRVILERVCIPIIIPMATNWKCGTCSQWLTSPCF